MNKKDSLAQLVSGDDFFLVSGDDFFLKIIDLSYIPMYINN